VTLGYGGEVRSRSDVCRRANVHNLRLASRELGGQGDLTAYLEMLPMNQTIW
jgi:hypothetical protein